MWKAAVVLLLCVSGYCWAGPVGTKRNMPIVMREDEPKIMEVYASNELAEAEKPAATPEAMYMSTLTLPSNATSIRADITDGFSCENKTYGYYADVENDCQIFHVCLPVTYADGKENTFRWSFICPEETIFSQDSFTCMRPEDMTIDCEESAQYYELNRNFGQVDDETNKHNQASGMVTKPALNEPIESEIPQSKPAVAEENDEMIKATPAPIVSEPMKPVKVSKPHRRKPGQSSYGVQHKLTATHPLRKVPQVSAMPAEAVEAAVVEAVEETKPEEVRPATKFTKRPVIASNIREKIQQNTANAEPSPIRAELYNQNRKRPAYLNRKESVTSKPAAVEEIPMAPLEAAEIVAEPVIVVKTETPVDSSSHVESETDADTQASETAEVFVKPQEVVVAEAEKTVPMPVIAEAQAEEEAAPVVIESVEKLPAEAEVQAEPTKVEPIMEESMPNNSEEMMKPLEAFEEIPAVILESEEPASEPVEMSEAAVASETAESSAEAALPTLEEMEDSKPADAIETMPATPEMEHVDPMVQQMFESPDNHQSAGGFKPVDPAMAAEAEALINDFINSLPKAEHMQAETGATNEAPAVELGEPELFKLENTEVEAVPETEAQVDDVKLPESQEEQTKEEEAEPVKEIEKQSEIVDTQEAAHPVEEQLRVDESAMHEELSQDKGESSEASEVNASVVDAKPAVSAAPSAEEHQEWSDMPAEVIPVTVENAAEVEEKPLETDALKTINESAADEEAKDGEAPAEPNESQPPVASAIATKSVADDTPAPQMIEPSGNMMMMMNHFPTDMFQIPVQIIETPMEEMQHTLKTEEQIPSVVSTATEEEPAQEIAPLEPEAAEAPVMMASQPETLKYKPISIDDIVELVKERLDQMPSAEKGMPMQMVMDNGEQAIAESGHAADEKPTSAEEEEIVMPIYERAPAEMNALKSTQELTMTGEVNTDNTEAEPQKPEETEIAIDSGKEKATDESVGEMPAAAKASRAYRARSIKTKNAAKMDPRKRRFLFRSDAN